MIGAIAGDIIGSVHEFVAIPTKTKDFGSLFVDNIGKAKVTAGESVIVTSADGFSHKAAVASHFTDDTVCTIAVARWLMDRSKDVATHMRETCQEYPRRGYGGMFSKWVMDPNMGSYNSWGNGAPMRVSPVGWAAKSLPEAYELAKITADITHNHPQAVKGAQVVAGIIFLAKTGSSKDNAINKVLDDLDDDGYYRSIIAQTLDEIRPTYTFKVSSKDTVPQAIRCLIEGINFEDVIRNSISLGGDADTIAAIAGSMAEPIYGIPDEIIKESIGRLDNGHRQTILDFSKKFMAI
jgi:ADP-ribosylglycohydrolase